jgi:hypothetical protein
MITDDFCSSYDCTIEIQYNDQCYEYKKEDADLNCHLYCALDNCTKIPVPEVMCVEYTCWPKSTSTTTTTTTTSSPPIPSPTSEIGIIVGTFAALLVVLLLAVGAWLLYRRRSSTDQHLLDNQSMPPSPHVRTPSTSSSEDMHVPMQQQDLTGEEEEHETPAMRESRELLQKIRAWRPFVQANAEREGYAQFTSSTKEAFVHTTNKKLSVSAPQLF